MPKLYRTRSLTRLHWELKGQVYLYLRHPMRWVMWSWNGDQIPLWRSEVRQDKGYLPSLSEMERGYETSCEIVGKWTDTPAKQETQELLFSILKHQYLSSVIPKGDKSKIREWFTLAPIPQRKLTQLEALRLIQQFHLSLDWKLGVAQAFLWKLSNETQREMLLFPKPPKWLTDSPKVRRRLENARSLSPG